MNECPKVLVTAGLAVFLLSACSSGFEVISTSPDSIAIEVDSEEDLDSAADEAADHCEDSDREAVLDRTEVVGAGAVAYFNCQ